MPDDRPKFAVSVESLADAREVFEKALVCEKGLRIAFASKGQLIKFRHRLYSARKRDREQSYKAYTADNPMRGKSSYDSLLVHYDEENSTEDRHVMLVVRAGALDLPYGVISMEEIE